MAVNCLMLMLTRSSIKGERERWGNFLLGLRSVGRGGDGKANMEQMHLYSDK